MRIEFKNGVKMGIPHSAMVLAIVAVGGVLHNNYGVPCIITSMADGKHSDNSLHYDMQAFDIRTKHLPPGVSPEQVAADIRGVLTDEWDVVVEDTHIHIERDLRSRE